MKLIARLEENPTLTLKTENVIEMLQGKSLDISIISDISENKRTFFKNVIEYLAHLAVVVVNIVLAYK